MKLSKSSTLSSVNRSVSGIYRNTANEILPNENLFKQDQDYKMKSSLVFQESEEQNCNRNLFIRYHKLIYIMIVFSSLRNIYFLVREWGNLSILISLIRIAMIFVLLLCGIMIIHIDKFISNFQWIRIYVEIENLLEIVGGSLTNSSSVEKITCSFLFRHFLTGMVYNFSFCLTLEESALYYFVESLGVLMFAGQPDRSCFLRPLLNIFSPIFRNLIFVSTIVLCIQYSLVKAQRELWALYDSFKRSYFTIKNIYDDFPLPILIVKRANLQILYKNTQTDWFYLRTKFERGGERYFNKTPSFRRVQAKCDTLKDLFAKSIEKLLEAEIENCIENHVESFDIPILFGDKVIKYKDNNKFPTLCENEFDSVQWAKLFIIPCTWKGGDAMIVRNKVNKA